MSNGEPNQRHRMTFADSEWREVIKAFRDSEQPYNIHPNAWLKVEIMKLVRGMNRTENKQGETI